MPKTPKPKTFTITAATGTPGNIDFECITLIIDSTKATETNDLIKDIKLAVKNYALTEEGYNEILTNDGYFSWNDIMQHQNHPNFMNICKKHGFTIKNIQSTATIFDAEESILDDTMTVEVTGISWELDGISQKEAGVQSTAILEDIELDDDIADKLSDKYGWLVKKYKSVKAIA